LAQINKCFAQTIIIKHKGDDLLNQINILIKKLLKNAIIPEYATEGSAGFDFHAVVRSEGYCVAIHPNETKLIQTGLAMEIPLGYELQIRPRSGLSLKTKLRIANSPATIDSDYRGEIGIIVENIGDEPIMISHHDRIAQGILCEVPQANFIEVDNLSDSQRGSGGFGSTNANKS
jgi:dUTP pyrophosphatase